MAAVGAVSSSPDDGARPRASRALEPALPEQPDPVHDAPAVDGVAGPARRPRTRLLLAVAGGVLVADVVTKLLVVSSVAPGENVRVLGGLVYVTQLRNVGAAFSFAQGATILFSVIAVAVAVVIVRTSRRLWSAAWATALGLVLGGALGNLIDRIYRGHVIDFILVYWKHWSWPAFNLADSAISVGAVLLIAFGLRSRKPHQT